MAEKLSPQGYIYGIDPKTIHPFWGFRIDPEGYDYTEFTTKTEITDLGKKFHNIAMTIGTEKISVPVSLFNVVPNDEFMAPFVYDGNTAFLVCEGSAADTLTITGVFAIGKVTAAIDSVTESDPDISGLVGPEGPEGPAGPQGPQGEPGKDGEPGAAGKDGANGITPDISISATVENTTGTPSVTVEKSGTTEAPAFAFDFSGLKGEKGDTGATGPEGPQGEPGAAGATGPQGPQGEPGAAGATGPQGPQGPAGADGATGPEGPQGPQGEPGAAGVTPEITATATIDATTGTPAVEVTKSGTLEEPAFAFAFSGLKGEGGGLNVVKGSAVGRNDTTGIKDIDTNKNSLAIIVPTNISFNVAEGKTKTAIISKISDGSESKYTIIDFFCRAYTTCLINLNSNSNQAIFQISRLNTKDENGNYRTFMVLGDVNGSNTIAQMYCNLYVENNEIKIQLTGAETIYLNIPIIDEDTDEVYNYVSMGWTETDDFSFDRIISDYIII